MKYSIQEETLTDIADAIREKTETTGEIYPPQMPEKIRSIATGNIWELLNNQDKSNIYFYSSQWGSATDAGWYARTTVIDFLSECDIANTNMMYIPYSPGARYTNWLEVPYKYNDDSDEGDDEGGSTIDDLLDTSYVYIYENDSWQTYYLDDFINTYVYQQKSMEDLLNDWCSYNYFPTDGDGYIMQEGYWVSFSTNDDTITSIVINNYFNNYDLSYIMEEYANITGNYPSDYEGYYYSGGWNYFSSLDEMALILQNEGYIATQNIEDAIYKIEEEGYIVCNSVDDMISILEGMGYTVTQE